MVKAFTNGQVFYSEDMDSLVLSSNMRFPTAAARDATLTGSLAPANGIVSVLADEQVTYRYRSGWQPQPGTVMFSYARTSTVSISPSSVQDITGFNVDQLGSRNFGNRFAPVTGLFTPPVNGYYEFSGSACFAQVSDTGGYRVAGTRCGSAGTYFHPEQCQMWSGTYGVNSTLLFAVFTGVVSLQTTQKASLFVFLSGSSAVNVGPCYFSARFMGAT